MDLWIDGNATNPLENHKERERTTTGVQVNNFFKKFSRNFSPFTALSFSPHPASRASFIAFLS